jgi:RHS repeat-associated protein
VKRVINNTTKYYIYDGDRSILEYGVAGNVNGKNVYGKGIDEILMRWDSTVKAPNPQTFYYQQDHEGSIRYLTNDSGARIEEYRYDAFGTPTIYDMSNPQHVRTASIVSNRFLFTGREWAANFRFYEYRARAYHPGLGRFMSEDPKLFDAGDYNLFRYCHNDPVDFTDPMGLYVILADKYRKETALYDPNAKSKTEFTKLYEKAREYATHNKDGSINQTASNAFKAIEQSKEFGIQINRTTERQYDAKQFQVLKMRDGSLRADVKWNPNLARENTNSTRNSPAAILLHEVWHGAEFVSGPGNFIRTQTGGTRAGMGQKTGSPEERRVLDLEQHVFPQLMNEGIRTDLEAKTFFPVSSPELGGKE